MADAELRRIARGPDAGWDPFDAALLRAADELHVDSFIADATWKTLSARYDVPQLIDAIDTCPSVYDPENLDGDGDGLGNACDNCPTIANPGQEDRGGLGASSRPNGRGDACECGDVNDDGKVTTADVGMMQRALLVPPTTTMTKAYRCDVGGSAGCSASDLALLKRAVLVPPTATLRKAALSSFANICGRVR